MDIILNSEKSQKPKCKGTFFGILLFFKIIQLIRAAVDAFSDHLKFKMTEISAVILSPKLL